jgi:hypothetical protein
MRRRRKSGMTLDHTQDPGKDLFAYLFLLIMVFSFMLMMSMEERYDRLIGQMAPEKQKEQESGQSTLVAINNDNIGRLKKSNGKLYMVFQNRAYDPLSEIEQLAEDQHIVSLYSDDGQEGKYIYLEQTNSDKVFLHEYLSAFQSLSSRGISVAFAEVEHGQGK